MIPIHGERERVYILENKDWQRMQTVTTNGWLWMNNPSHFYFSFCAFLLYFPSFPQSNVHCVCHKK